MIAGGKIVTDTFDITIGKCTVIKDPWENQYVPLDSSKGNLKTDSEKKVLGLKNNNKINLNFFHYYGNIWEKSNNRNDIL